jgi:DNA polymerase III subunit epsilon
VFRHLTLSRPLAVVDLETTGTRARTDRIVEISVLKIEPTGERDQRTRRVNPGIPIPAEATAIHGIRDEDVRDCPGFGQLARGLAAFLGDSDLCGFNLAGFDSQMLDAEFKRAGVDFKLDGRVMLDPMKVFHRYEKRDLTAAVRFYLNRDHAGAHGAEADVLATAELLDAMCERYADLPRTPEGIQGLYRDPHVIDSSGRFRRDEEGKARFTFGKYRGARLYDVAVADTPYCQYLLAQDFPADAKELMKAAVHAAGQKKSEA